MHPLVSVITVNYNQPQVTAELLRSLCHITYPNVEVWVVDNASPRQGVDELIPIFPEVHFLKSSTNLGFAGGNNLAVRQARGKYLLFLNNDTEVPPGFLEPLVERMEADPQIGMVSPKIKYYYEDNLIQYAGSTEINPLTGRGHFIGHRQPDDGSFSRSGQTAYVHGAAMLVSRAVLEKTGLMDDTYFLYYEELDWCARARRDGFGVWYVAESEILHKESVSTGKQSTLKVYYQTRNRILFIRRNYRSWQRMAGLMFFSCISIPKNSLTYLLKKRWDYLSAFWRGVTWHLTH
ncbi:glycosyltransferase family 2 protein [Telluribacter sp. SYSU D00476]|uniref:glycosyltransferase family 2 protein n=1 Tax=Telluribacter sp. SYSU D00476 TaxID=2811430 RepID=UPI001FF4E256|nr:glycosyltransferase family 2 protein [Telluribacter sp. SYSU D00476]